MTDQPMIDQPMIDQAATNQTMTDHPAMDRVPMDRARRRELIDRYADGHRVVLDAVCGSTDRELDARPVEGGWTAREIVHHLADSEMTSAIRLRRLLAEEAPSTDGYDEEEFARRLRYGTRPVGAALDALGAARRTTAEILATLSVEEWSRAGTHPEHGRYSVGDWLEIYAAHAHEHADQIRRARAAASP